MKLHKVIKRLIVICFCLGAAGLLVLIGINAHVKGVVKDRIVEPDKIPIEEADCIIVKAEPTYLGDFIDIHGNGDITND